MPSFANCCSCKQTITPAGSEADVVVDGKVKAHVHGNRGDCIDRAKRKYPGAKVQGGTRTVREWSPPARKPREARAPALPGAPAK
jgi:hypothetical protein